ncbi:3-alpha-hydroxysteroid dehydrogenase/carbonyl reductase [Pelagimonas phthalicica]|uniref:3-alpha-hydroxysteroid dehydrogenase/carbonyl reductase n=1 Tax=Pelagimonas phthalicica TaxID=1037362 RepID=A0A238JGX2_9RHOB|nr:SDR family oxidoreductase [Pelagimonas phthalicica]TDS92138.1 NAD(P)-dependent dehydrogenase (short-subunit alcohol dehydrogenase family) [Pelagimonas phthalicica]SMX29192.1 3-alpha-hydroxysteroid dehydrogenase/carbonyl reductase [Pelagimonas phthalicica]
MPQSTYAITGVSSGIGAELARILKERGHYVIGFDIATSAEHVDRLIALDLNDPGSIAAATKQLDIPVDGLCNNAGLPPREGLETTILQVNYLGQRDFLKRILPLLKPGASIVNMASRAGQGWRDGVHQVKRLSALSTPKELKDFIAAEGIDATRAYNLSKEALILWSLAETETMIGRGLRINTLSPGAIATGILDDFARAFGDKMARNVERAGRPGNPVEIANVAAFLLSPEANWIKGSDISIDGGMSAFAATEMLDLESLQVCS